MLEYPLLALVLWHVNFTALSISSTLLPAGYSHPGPSCFRHQPQWAALYQESTNRSTQTNGGCLDIRIQTINTSSAPSMFQTQCHSTHIELTNQGGHVPWILYSSAQVWCPNDCSAVDTGPQNSGPRGGQLGKVGDVFLDKCCHCWYWY